MSRKKKEYTEEQINCLAILKGIQKALRENLFSTKFQMVKEVKIVKENVCLFLDYGVIEFELQLIADFDLTMEDTRDFRVSFQDLKTVNALIEQGKEVNMNMFTMQLNKSEEVFDLKLKPPGELIMLQI